MEIRQHQHWISLLLDKITEKRSFVVPQMNWWNTASRRPHWNWIFIVSAIRRWQLFRCVATVDALMSARPHTRTNRFIFTENCSCSCLFFCVLSSAIDSSRAWVKSESGGHWRRYVHYLYPNQNNQEGENPSILLIKFFSRFRIFMQAMTSTGNAKVKPLKHD